MQNVRKAYECSTAHLPEKTARAIDIGSFAKPAAMQNEHGWLIYVPETLAELPDGVDCDAFRAIMALAIDSGCDYVLFDRDVPPVDYLKIFDW